MQVDINGGYDPCMETNTNTQPVRINTAGFFDDPYTSVKGESPAVWYVNHKTEGRVARITGSQKSGYQTTLVDGTKSTRFVDLSEAIAFAKAGK